MNQRIVREDEVIYGEYGEIVDKKLLIESITLN